MESPVSPTTRSPFGLVGLVLTLLVALVGLGAYAAFHLKQANALQVQADTAKARAKTLTQEASETDSRADGDQAKSNAAEQEVDCLTMAFQAAPRPPKALPPPAADPALAQGLEAAGMHPGLAVAPVGLAPSTLERGDAELAWRWNQESLRVPLLERRLDVAEQLVASQDVAAQALKKEALDTAAARDLWRSANGAQLDRAEALQAEVTALHKAGTALKVTGATAVVALVVRALVRGK